MTPLDRRRRHMAVAVALRAYRGRNKWTEYAKGSKADDEMPTLSLRHRPHKREAKES